MAHKDVSTAKMSTVITFWHFWVPNKSKKHVHILQACLSFHLAFACDLLCNYCGFYSECFFGQWIISNFSGNGVLHLQNFEYIKTAQHPLVELTGAASIILSFLSLCLGTHKLLALYFHLSSYLDTVKSRTWIKDVGKKNQQTGKLAGEMKFVWTSYEMAFSVHFKLYSWA